MSWTLSLSLCLSAFLVSLVYRPNWAWPVSSPHQHRRTDRQTGRACHNPVQTDRPKRAACPRHSVHTLLSHPWGHVCVCVRVRCSLERVKPETEAISTTLCPCRGRREAGRRFIYAPSPPFDPPQRSLTHNSPRARLFPSVCLYVAGGEKFCHPPTFGMWGACGWVGGGGGGEPGCDVLSWRAEFFTAGPWEGRGGGRGKQEREEMTLKHPHTHKLTLKSCLQTWGGGWQNKSYVGRPKRRGNEEGEGN